jgi:hypothetical protein
MIGKRIKVGRVAHTVVGFDDGRYILQPLKFGPPITATPAELGIDPPQAADEEAGWRALDAEARRVVLSAGSGEGPHALSPEEFFAAAAKADEDAE